MESASTILHLRMRSCKLSAKEYEFSLDTPYYKYSAENQENPDPRYGRKEVKVHYRGQRGVGVYAMLPSRADCQCGSATLPRNLIGLVESRSMRNSCALLLLVCHGQRLKPSALAVTVGGKNIIEVTDFSITRLLSFIVKA